MTEQKKKSNAGRKSKYHTHIEPYLGAIAAMCRNGATLQNLGEKFGVAAATLIEYKKQFPEFYKALSENSDIADFNVENKLYENAMTGNLTAQIFWLKNRQSRRWRDRQHVFQQSTQVQKFEYDNLSDDELQQEEQVLEAVDTGDDVEWDGELH